MQQKSPSIVAVGAVVAIIIGIVMGVMNNPRISSSLNYLEGKVPNSQTSASGMSVVGGPSLSSEQVNAILTNAGSPAAGSGQTFYDDSIQYNIDDAVALAFFHHESTYGIYGAAAQTLGIGNINCTAGYSCIGRFRAYSSWSAGIDDWYQLIKNEYVNKGATTVESIVPIYAPPGDGNDPQKYINSVEDDVQAWRAA